MRRIGKVRWERGCLVESEQSMANRLEASCMRARAVSHPNGLRDAAAIAVNWRGPFAVLALQYR